MTDKTKHTLGPLTFGLDIGIASVGWAVLAQDRIVDMGVRAFEAAEDNDGNPKNKKRRDDRVTRHRYDMRSWRLKRLSRLFRNIGMLTKEEARHLFSDRHDKHEKHVCPWQLRAEALSRPLSRQEWAKVIYHIVKHRGFKFFSKSEDPTIATIDVESTNDAAAKAERDGLRDGLAYTSELPKKYPHLQTIGQIAFELANAKQIADTYRDANGNPLGAADCEGFRLAYRNKGKSYRHAFRRDDLKAELNILFDRQHNLGNPFSTLALPDGTERLTEIAVGSETISVEANFRAQVFALLELQHPPICIEQMDAMIGDCELESEARNGRGKAERRAAKHSFSNERATWLQTLNNLRIKRDGKETSLTEQERSAVLNLPYEMNRLTFKQMREFLRERTGFPAHWREASFTKLSYSNRRKNDGSWINIVLADGSKKALGKFIENEKERKAVNKELKTRLESGSMNFSELRQLFKLGEGDSFECQKKYSEIIPLALEDQHPIAFDELDSGKTFIKLLAAKSKSSRKLSRKAVLALEGLRTKPGANLADLRIAIEHAEPMESGWQFEKSHKEARPILPVRENNTDVPIEYEDAQQIEEEPLIELKGWHAFKRALENSQSEWWNCLQVAWRDPMSDAGLSAACQLDSIAEVLTKAQTDAYVEKGIAPLHLDKAQREALSGIEFKQFRNLSLKALRNLLPFLEQGTSFTEACNLAGYQTVAPPPRMRHLPPLEACLYERIRHGREKGFKKTGHQELRYKDLTNPVVARAFNQARLVLNALIDRYDQSPAYVHIELARDIARPRKGKWSNGKYIEGRMDVQARQRDNRTKRQEAKDNFANANNGKQPSDRLMLKLRLLDEQMGQCIYTQDRLDRDKVIEDENYAQIDHIWPRSHTFDNSMENLVLVHAHANQDKGNRIPYDYINNHPRFGAAPDERAHHWRRVAAHVMACKGMSDSKQKRLLATELDADEFLARNLVDTRYTTRLFARMVRNRLLFDGQIEDLIEDIDPSESGKARLAKFHKTRVRTPQGGVVSFLRQKWFGDIKNREESDKHHAMDACIIAACTPELIHRVNSWFSNQERVPNRFENLRDGTYADKGTGEVISKDEARLRGLYLPAPWDEESPGRYRKEFMVKYKEIFVSRAPRRKKAGALHEATNRSPKLAAQRVSYVSVPLSSLKLDKLNDIVGADDPRNRSLIDLLEKRLRDHNDDGEKAFAAPLYKPSGIGKQAPLVRTVKIISSQKIGAFVGNSLVDLGEMLRVEVLMHEGRYLFKPVYGIAEEKLLNPVIVPEEARFQFSLSKNDFVQIQIEDKWYEGYFVMYESDGRVTLRAHDQPQPDKKYFRRAIGNASVIRKIHIDVLGNRYLAPPEVRRELA